MTRQAFHAVSRVDSHVAAVQAPWLGGGKWRWQQLLLHVKSYQFLGRYGFSRLTDVFGRCCYDKPGIPRRVDSHVAAVQTSGLGGGEWR